MGYSLQEWWFYLGDDGVGKTEQGQHCARGFCKIIEPVDKIIDGPLRNTFLSRR
jgi:hypothetical protein